MFDVIVDAWPWLLPAFLIGLLCGWYVTLAWCKDNHPRSAQGGAGAATRPTRLPRARVLDLNAASKVLGFKVKLDDLALIEGIGPRIADLLKVDGISTWRRLGATRPRHLRKILEHAGPRYNLHDPATWPRQARLLSKGKWAEYKKLTDKLVGGK